MSYQGYFVGIKWGSRVERYAELTGQIRDYLEILRSLHPEFAAWQLFKPTSGFSAACETWAAVAQHWDAGYSLVEGDQRDDLNNLGPDDAVTDNTWSYHGFSLDLFSAEPGAPAGKQSREDGIQLSINIGSHYRNGIDIEIPATIDGVGTYVFMRRLLLASVAHWMADNGAVRVPDFLTLVLQGRSLPAAGLNASWLTYLRNPYLASSIKPIDACRTELLGDDGILFSLSEHVPDPLNPGEIARARDAQAWLDSFHFHHEWTVFGWPYDAADEVYARQITGAPEGAVYAVGFVPFDGYDSVRKVLLFARLFRLRDNCGLDLDPIYRDDSGKLESLPHVVQARQHITAVRYVGASNPIEWHVGIEQKAQALKVLLNDWAGIPEQQLRVVHTPFEGELLPMN